MNFQSTSRKTFKRNLAAVAAPTITSQKEPKEFCQPSIKHLTLSVLLMLRSLSKHMPCVYAPGWCHTVATQRDNLASLSWHNTTHHTSTAQSPYTIERSVMTIQQSNRYSVRKAFTGCQEKILASKLYELVSKLFGRQHLSVASILIKARIPASLELAGDSELQH